MGRFRSRAEAGTVSIEFGAHARGEVRVVRWLRDAAGCSRKGLEVGRLFCERLGAGKGGREILGCSDVAGFCGCGGVVG